MNSIKALRKMVKNFQFNNAEQTREIHQLQLRVNQELLERVVKLEQRVAPKRQGSPYDLSRQRRREARLLKMKMNMNV